MAAAVDIAISGLMLAGATLGLSGAAFAQEGKSALPREANLPEVIITGDAGKETAWGPVSGYAAKRSATCTKTDTPILETPASVQMITRDVMDDQKAVNLKDVYENASGVQQAGNTLNAQAEVLPIIRGFESPSLMRNGLRSSPASSCTGRSSPTSLPSVPARASVPGSMHTM